MKRSWWLGAQNPSASVTVSISVSIRRPYQAVYLKLTGWWGLTLQISTPSNFPFDLRMASLVCVSYSAELNLRLRLCLSLQVKTGAQPVSLGLPSAIPNLFYLILSVSDVSGWRKRASLVKFQTF